MPEAQEVGCVRSLQDKEKGHLIISSVLMGLKLRERMKFLFVALQVSKKPQLNIL